MRPPNAVPAPAPALARILACISATRLLASSILPFSIVFIIPYALAAASRLLLEASRLASSSTSNLALVSSCVSLSLLIASSSFSLSSCFFSNSCSALIMPFKLDDSVSFPATFCKAYNWLINAVKRSPLSSDRSLYLMYS